MLIPTQLLVTAALAVVTTYHTGDGYTPGTITASGEPVVPGRTVACERHIPLGTHVWIAGVGIRVCLDRMHRRFEGEPVNFDVAVEPGERVPWTGERLYRVLSSDTHVRTWYKEWPRGVCESAPGPTGSWTAAHCLPVDPRAGWTVYLSVHRVSRWSVDPERDLAHASVGADPGVRLRRVEFGERARVADSWIVARELVTMYVVPGGYSSTPPGRPLTVRRWCLDDGPGVKPGMSGAGIYGEDGALLGIINGGSMGRDGTALGTPDCGGWQRVIGADVP